MVELKSSDDSTPSPDHTTNLLTTSNGCTNGVTPADRVRTALLNELGVSDIADLSESGSESTGYNEIVRINVGGGIFEVCLGLRY